MISPFFVVFSFRWSFQSTAVQAVLKVLVRFLQVLGSFLEEQKSIKADKITREYLLTTNLPGLSISVAKKGKIVFSRGYGYADVEQKKTIDPSKTKFRIGSVSKTYAATALAILSERKILDLEEDIYKYVSSFPSKKWKFNH